MKIKFDKDGINPTPWDLKKEVDELVENGKDFSFANPLVLDYMRLLIKKNILNSNELFLIIDLNEGDDSVEPMWVECPFIDKMWVLPEYDNCCDFGATYPTNSKLTIFEDIIMELL